MENGVCSKESVNGSRDVWSCKDSDSSSADHLVVMVHGILGSATDWKFGAEQFVKRLPDKVFVHCSERNMSKLTLDGVDVMGERLAQEVLEVIERKPNLQKISFVAHSVGGLVARYAIGRLYTPQRIENVEDSLGDARAENSRGTIAGLEAINFITVATPHLGSRGNKQVSNFIYNHGVVLALMRSFTNKDLVRPAPTRFATAYLTLQSMYSLKQPLEQMFTSKEWHELSFSKKSDGKEVKKIILSDRFWTCVAYALKTTKPLVQVLRMTDGEQMPGMGFIYGAMDRAKEEIARNLGNEVGAYKEIWKIIDDRWESQLHRHLHAAAYLLNPQIQYADNTPSRHPEIRRGFILCMDKLLPDLEDQSLADVQVDKFLKRQGFFGVNLAKTTIFNRSPADWWGAYGDETPQLQSLAIKILSLTCSSSGCERNWSTFNMVPFLFGVPAFEKVARFVIHLIFRRTGRHLFLNDNDEGKPPLLRCMVEDEDGNYFMSALGTFKRRVAYSNACYDHIVGWRTSSIRRNSELPKWEGSLDEKYPHIVYYEHCKACDAEELDPSSMEDEDSDKIEVELVKGISRV